MESIQQCPECHGSVVASRLQIMVGKKVLIRTVVYHWVGLVDSVLGGFVLLKRASWLGDTGRYGTVLRDGWDDYTEIEPVPGDGAALVSVGSVVDCVEWIHDLPRDQR